MSLGFVSLGHLIKQEITRIIENQIELVIEPIEEIICILED